MGTYRSKRLPNLDMAEDLQASGSYSRIPACLWREMSIHSKNRHQHHHLAIASILGVSTMSQALYMSSLIPPIVYLCIPGLKKYPKSQGRGQKSNSRVHAFPTILWLPKDRITALHNVARKSSHFKLIQFPDWQLGNLAMFSIFRLF